MLAEIEINFFKVLKYENCFNINIIHAIANIVTTIGLSIKVKIEKSYVFSTIWIKKSLTPVIAILTECASSFPAIVFLYPIQENINMQPIYTATPN